MAYIGHKITVLRFLQLLQDVQLILHQTLIRSGRQDFAAELLLRGKLTASETELYIPPLYRVAHALRMQSQMSRHLHKVSLKRGIVIDR